MKTISLTQSKVALVDDADYERLAVIKWCAVNVRGDDRKWYAYSGGLRITMHRFILGAQKGQLVDHIDRDGLNNQRSNIRICTRTGNARNQGLSKRNSSGFKGVHRDHRAIARPWIAHIAVNRKNRHLGRFATPEEAARAYNVAAVELHGEFASLNEGV